MRNRGAAFVTEPGKRVKATREMGKDGRFGREAESAEPSALGSEDSASRLNDYGVNCTASAPPDESTSTSNAGADNCTYFVGMSLNAAAKRA